MISTSQPPLGEVTHAVLQEANSLLRNKRVFTNPLAHVAQCFACSRGEDDDLCASGCHTNLRAYVAISSKSLHQDLFDSVQVVSLVSLVPLALSWTAQGNSAVIFTFWIMGALWPHRHNTPINTIKNNDSDEPPPSSVLSRCLVLGVVTKL